MNKFTYYNVDTKVVTNSIESIFPNWGEDEGVAVFSPHDDDAILGAGYVIRAAKEAGARVYVIISCEGNAGYSIPEQKDEIIARRKKETIDAYVEIGVPEENIYRFGMSDFAAFRYLGWDAGELGAGVFERSMKFMRNNRITRVLVPNHNKEHADHTATHMIGAYDAPQAGDPILVDWGTPCEVKTVMEYSVWADFSVENAIENGRDRRLKANTIVKVAPEVEEAIDRGLERYV